MKKIRKKPIIIYVLILAALYVAIYVVPSVTGALVETYTVEYGSLRVSDDTTGYFIRDEEVYVATDSGKINRYIDEGTLVRKGTSILEITGHNDSETDKKFEAALGLLGSDVISDSNYKSRKEGIVNYYVDGYEGRFTPDNMDKISYETAAKAADADVVSLKRKSAAAGEPVFRVMDNSCWYLMCFIDASSEGRYPEGNRVKMVFDDGEVTGIVSSVNKAGSLIKVIVKSDNYYESSDRYRSENVTLVASDRSGLIVENSSIATEDGQEGVYVVNKFKEYEFVPVSIVASDGEKSVIEKSYYYDSGGNTVVTVNTYDEILKSPQDKE